MSWWISLVDSVTKEAVQVPRFEEGGAYAIGGQTEAAMDVTYNYSHIYNFGTLDAKVAGDVIPQLEAKINELGLVRGPDYWQPTQGNVGHALNVLLGWAKLYPSAVFEVN